jgi:hypothetical protein
VNAQLEALVLALEAVLQARAGEDANQMEALYQARLDDVLQRNPNLSPGTLQKMVDLAHRRWCRAQQKPPSLPPRA